MTATEIIFAIGALFKMLRTLITEGRNEATEDEVDAALGELGPSRQQLVDAIERARAREAGGG
jgi:hypothetical protein